MGLAASQAKLLSITARLSDNELRSQSITAAKMALASQTSEASKNYINALDATEFIYRTYDGSGNSVYTALTGAQLTTYSPIKNQYGLINTKGQILVSELDAANYEDSANINEFLEKYGVDRIDTGETRTVTNPGYEDAYDEWKKEYDEWLIKKPDKNDPIYWEEGVTSSSSELYDSFLWATAICYASALLSLSMSLGLPNEKVYDSSGHLVLEYTTYPPEFNVYKDDNSGTYRTLSFNADGKSCYSHVLSHLLDFGDYNTTTGQKITISSYYGEHGYYAHWWGNTDAENRRASRAAELAKILSENHNPVYYCCQKDPANVDITPSSSDAEKLMSDYYFDKDGNVKTKTLQQKIVDLNYAMCENILSDQELFDSMQHFVNEDLKVLFESSDVFLEDDYNDDYEEWLSKKPPFDVPTTIEETIYEYSDKDKAQWYVNLWHRMNGASDEKDGTITTSTTTTDVEVTSNGTTTTTTTNTYTRNRWDILEDGLMNSQKWLKYALESGTISLERVNFTNPTEEGTGLKYATWTSIIYTNALDISEQTDETAIAKAEAEYEQKTRELENKDKQYDSILKLLDTEHTALQTEYDSVKSVISKNTDRTLKMYSA